LWLDIKVKQKSKEKIMTPGAYQRVLNRWVILSTNTILISMSSQKSADGLQHDLDKMFPLLLLLITDLSLE
jgi:hypothetical protein